MVWILQEVFDPRQRTQSQKIQHEIAEYEQSPFGTGKAFRWTARDHAGCRRSRKTQHIRQRIEYTQQLLHEPVLIKALANQFVKNDKSTDRQRNSHCPENGPLIFCVDEI